MQDFQNTGNLGWRQFRLCKPFIPFDVFSGPILIFLEKYIYDSNDILYHGSFWGVGRFPVLPLQDRIGSLPTFLILGIYYPVLLSHHIGGKHASFFYYGVYQSFEENKRFVFLFVVFAPHWKYQGEGGLIQVMGII